MDKEKNMKMAFEHMPYGVCVIKVNRYGAKECRMVYSNKKLEALLQSREYGQTDRQRTNILPFLEEKWNHYFYQAAFEDQSYSDSGYSKEMNCFLKVSCYPYEEGYCTCLVEEDESLSSRKKALGALTDSFYVVALCDLKKDSIVVTKQVRGNEHILNQELKYSEYSKHIMSQVATAEESREILRIISPEYIKRNLTQKNRVISHDYRRYIAEEKRNLWSQFNLIWVKNDDDGNVCEFVVAVRDIHKEKERKMTEQCALVDACELANQASIAKSSFLKKVSHDLRTPLNSIMGMTVIAENYINNQERVGECLKKINVASAQLMDIINEILDMNRIEAGQVSLMREEVNLQDTILSAREKLEPLLKEKKHAVYISYDSVKHQEVYSDRRRLEMVIQNILNNAIEYTPEYGTIKVKLQELESKSEQIGKYSIIIEDNGIGMDRELQENIFQPFYTGRRSSEKKEGIGLGMSIVRNLIQMMDGDIQVESTEGEGTKVFVTLSMDLVEKITFDDIMVNLPEKKAKSKLDYIRRLKFDGKKALLVDDNEKSRESVKRILNRAGIYVVEASNGKEAVKLYQENNKNFFDIIFMDIQMPEMSGYQAAKMIRDINRDDEKKIPITAMTSKVYAEDIRLSMNAGMNEHIGKPMDLEELGQILTKWLS